MNDRSFFEGKSIGFKVLVFILLIIIGFSLFNIVGSLIAGSIWPKDELINTPNAIRIVMAFGTVGTFLIPAFFYLFFDSKTQNQDYLTSPFLTILYPSKNQNRSLFLVIIASLLIIPLIAYIGELNQSIKLPHTLKNIEGWMKSLENENASILELLTKHGQLGTLLLNFIVMAFIPAFSEEFFFRGAVQKILKGIIKNNHIVILITAFIFSTIHFQFYGFFPRFILGIYLGYLAVWSGTLFLPIVAHFLHNGISLCIEFVSQNSLNRAEELKISDISGFNIFLPILIFVLLIIIYFIYLDLKKSKPI